MENSIKTIKPIPTTDSIRYRAMIWYFNEVNEIADTLMIDLKNGQYSTWDDCYQATWSAVESHGLHNRTLDAICCLVATSNDDAAFDFGEVNANVDSATIYSQLALNAFFQDIRERLVELCEEEGLDLDEPHARPCEECKDLTDINDLKRGRCSYCILAIETEIEKE